ncbi:MAG: hypothetical protein ACFN06_01235 [Limosilactobacillus oris]
MKTKVQVGIALLCVALSMVIPSYSAYNIVRYNYYYATHMKHPQNQYPFVDALARTNMPAHYLPNYHVQNFSKEGLHGFHNATITKENVLQPGDYLEIASDQLSYAYSKEEFKDYKTKDIDFDSNGTLSHGQKVSPRLRRVLNTVQAELKSHCDRPPINLQWVYNWYFKL